MCSFRRKRKSAGFTLIELLVVIAIIAILAAILFPVFVKAKSSAQRAKCVNNMKQLSFAMMNYQSDYDTRYPYAGASGFNNYMHKVTGRNPRGGSATCADALKKYVKNEEVFWCPLFVTRFPGQANRNIFKWSYWFYCPHNTTGSGNEFVRGYPGCMLCGQMASFVTAPSKKPVITEITCNHSTDIDTTDVLNMAYCDGHVRTITCKHDASGTERQLYAYARMNGAMIPAGQLPYPGYVDPVN